MNYPKKDLKNLFHLFETHKKNQPEKGLDYLKELIFYDWAFRRIIKNANGNYFIYPELTDLPTEQDLLQYYSSDLKMNTQEIINFLEPIINTKKAELKAAKIENYYGYPKYLILRTKAIYDAVTLLSNRHDIEESLLVNKVLTNLNYFLNTMLNIVGLENNNETYTQLNNFNCKLNVNKNQYDLLRDCYEKVLRQENLLMDISNKIWQLYALNNNGVLIHQLTSNAVESAKMLKICTSFYSDNVSIITRLSNNIGYAYPMDINNTFSVCAKDVGSWQITKEYYLERGMPEHWQLDDTNMWYEEPYHSKLFPPEYIEEQVLANNSFAEIVIDNRHQNVKPLYCFYTSNATPEQINTINSLAEKQGLEVKPLKLNVEMTR